MSNPVQSATGYFTPSDGFRHAVGLDGGCAVRETFYSPSVGQENDLLAVYSTAIGISGFFTDDDGRQHLIVADANGYLSEIHWKPGDIRWYELPIGPFSGVVSISAFCAPDSNYRIVIVATDDGNITEIFYNPSIGSHISQPPLTQYGFVPPAFEEIAPQPATIGAPTAASLSAYAGPSTAGRTLALTGDVVKQYALSEHAGIWRSLGGGAWQQLPDSAIGGWGDPLVADPANSSHVVLGNQAGAWETVDGGDNWQPVVTGQAVAAVCFETDGSLIMAAGANVSRRDRTTGEVSTVLTTGDQNTAVAIGGSYTYLEGAQ